MAWSTDEKAAAYQAEYDAQHVEERRARQRRYEEKNKDTRSKPRHSPETRRSNKLRDRYGISVAEYDAMFLEQQGVCAICKDPPGKRRLCVDHDHKTNTVRRLLCFRCNTVLGRIDDDVELLLEMVAYLEYHAQSPL